MIGSGEGSESRLVDEEIVLDVVDVAGTCRVASVF
jgi:hypothetical protein